MITDENKWIFIEAFLAGKLDASAQEQVRQKMDEDPLFQNDVLIRKALNRELNRKIEQEQQAEESDLVDQFMADQLVSAIIKPLPIPIWRQPWVQAAAALILVLGLGWLTLKYYQQPETLAVQVSYNQLGSGMAGDSSSRQTTFLIEFSSGGPVDGEYISGEGRIHIYLPELPNDTKQWVLSDDPERGGYLLKTPQGQTYLLDRETFRTRKPLISIK